MERLRADLLAHASATPRSTEELGIFIEEWVAAHRPPLTDAELAHQRTYKWRPYLRTSALVRHPADGRRRRATLSLRPFRPLPPEVRTALLDEAERLFRSTQPGSADYQVALEGPDRPLVTMS
jgi:hypothetical protein